jgi:glycerophosphoryl diester phosphodiesterase
VVLNYAFAEENIVQKCIAAKLKVWLYTVNEQEAIRFWKSTKLIDGIISDDFTLLNEM